MILSIIIINYNTFDITSKCIESIYKNVSNVVFEVILVDNASSECNPKLFLSKFPSINLIQSKVNLGFAGGNNLGLNYAKGKYILLLNSDTILIEDCISPCINYLKEQLYVGVVSPKLLNPDLSYQKNARRYKNITREFLDAFRPIVKLLPYRTYSRYFLNQYFKGDYNTECDWLCGAFFMTRREIIDKLLRKKLDDRFFMYGEDALWCLQISNLGYKCFFLSEASLIHIGNASTGGEKKQDLKNLIHSREIELYSFRTSSFALVFLFKVVLVLKCKIAILFDKTYGT